MIDSVDPVNPRKRSRQEIIRFLAEMIVAVKPLAVLFAVLSLVVAAPVDNEDAVNEEYASQIKYAYRKQGVETPFHTTFSCDDDPLGWETENCLDEDFPLLSLKFWLYRKLSCTKDELTVVNRNAAWEGPLDKNLLVKDLRGKLLVVPTCPDPVPESSTCQLCDIGARQSSSTVEQGASTIVATVEPTKKADVVKATTTKSDEAGTTTQEPTTNDEHVVETTAVADPTKDETTKESVSIKGNDRQTTEEAQEVTTTGEPTTTERAHATAAPDSDVDTTVPAAADVTTKPMAKAETTTKNDAASTTPEPTTVKQSIAESTTDEPGTTPNLPATTKTNKKQHHKTTIVTQTAASTAVPGTHKKHHTKTNKPDPTTTEAPDPVDTTIPVPTATTKPSETTTKNTKGNSDDIKTMFDDDDEMEAMDGGSMFDNFDAIFLLLVTIILVFVGYSYRDEIMARLNLGKAGSGRFTRPQAYTRVDRTDHSL